MENWEFVISGICNFGASSLGKNIHFPTAANQFSGIVVWEGVSLPGFILCVDAHLRFRYRSTSGYRISLLQSLDGLYLGVPSLAVATNKT